MRQFRNASIQRKLTLIVMLTTTAALLLSCAGFATYEVTTYRKAMLRNLLMLGKMTGDNSAAALDFDDPKAAGEALIALKEQPNIIGACIYLKNGELFATYDRAGDGKTFTPPAFQMSGHSFGRGELIVFEPIDYKGDTAGVICLVSDMEALYHRLRQYALISATVFLVALCVALLISSQLQRLVSGPILHLVETARAVARDKNYSLRAVKSNQDELGALVDGFNQMLAQIQERDTALETARAGLEERVKERTNELATSQALYHSLVDQMPVGVFRKDREGRFVFVNAWYARLKGLKPETFAGKMPREIQVANLPRAGATRAELAELAVRGEIHHERIMQTGEQIETEECYASISTGKDQFLHVVKSPVFGPDGGIEGSQGITIDISQSKYAAQELLRMHRELQLENSERKQAEGRLAETSSLMESLLANTMDYIYFKDRESRFVRCSRSLASKFGQADPDALKGKTDFDLYQDERARPAFEDEQEIIRTGKPVIGRMEQAILPDGQVFWVLTTKLPWHDKEGNIIGTFGISKDITMIKEAELKRDQAEARLAESSSLMESLLANSVDNIYFKDRESRFVRYSRNMVPKFGRTHPEALKGRTDFDFFTEEHARQAYEDEQEIIRTGRPMIGKVEKETLADGAVTWALSTKLPWRDKEGNIIGTFGVSKDITLIKEAEAKLELAHKEVVETSRQAGMAEVATSVLHNVGNVLNSVNISCSLVAEKVRKSRVKGLAKAADLMQAHEQDLARFLAEDAKGRQLPGYLFNLSAHLAEEQQEILKELGLLTGNIDHIKEIVAMQQSYARVSGVLESLDAVELVEDALRMNMGALERHQVQVVREFDPSLPVTVEKHKVLQILVNLIRNAKYALDDAMPPEKRMILRATANGDDLVKISVVDNGVGIPAENLTRIFSHGFTTRKDGHGFGLHSGALAAQELGGSLTVHSDGAGRGACFTLEFPREPRKKATL